MPIIDALSRNHGLQEFRLHDGNNNNTVLSNHFLQTTARVLKDNTHLSYLWYDTWVDKDLEIDLYLRTNKLGRGYLLDYEDKHNNATHNDWIQALVASKDHVHVTGYWLSHNPALLVG